MSASVARVIEPILFFALGFLSAGFLLLLAAPAFARRARRLERRHLEATLPMSMNELSAEKDRVRADAALGIRKAEIELKAARDKTAEHAILVGRAREDARLLKEESARRQTAITALEAERDRLRQNLRETQEALRLKEAEAAELAEKSGALEKERDELGRLYEEASFSASSRQIEMVGRESDIDRLGGDVQAREREIERLRQAAETAKAERDDFEAQLVKARAERLALETELGEARRATGLFSGLRDGEQAEAQARLTAERDRLETRLAALMRENKKLREAAQAAAQATAQAAPQPPPSPGDLRGQMAELAAQVTALVARLEGPDGAVDRILAATPEVTGGPAPSLADRIRALRDRAAPPA